MPIKNLTLGLLLLMAGSALAHDTGYRVRNGDCDWTIAKRHGITVRQLHAMNPQTDWDSLRVGSKIRIPSSGQDPRSHAVHTSSLAHAAVHSYVVQQGENDWIIAHRHGVRLAALKNLNPGVDLSQLRPGQKLKVPAGKSEETVAAKRIRSAYAKINGDNVTIRRRPSRGSDSICTVDEGTRGEVLDRRGSWYQLRFPRGTVGWVRGDLLAASKGPRHSHHSSEVRIAALRHRRGHGNRAEKFDTSVVTMEWSQSGAKQILEKAASMRGVRYQWGEASRSGTDCSGFTSQVFRTQGIRLPRTSREQASVGKKVNYGELKPGDLVFFHTTRGHRVSHVGIYVGKGKFIHASSGGGQVQVNSLSDGYYGHRLVTARRVTSHKPSSRPHEHKKEHDAPASATESTPSDASPEGAGNR